MGETQGTSGGGLVVVKVECGDGVKALSPCGEGDTRRRRSPGGARIGRSFNRRRSTPHSPWREKALKSRAQGLVKGLGVQRQEGMSGSAKAGTAPRRGTNPCRAKPGRGCGVKQTRKACGGGSRRGREKRRGRNEARGWVSGRMWTPQANAAMRAWNPREGVSRAQAREAGRSWKLWRRREARGRMKPTTQVGGGRRREEKPQGPAEMPRSRRVRGTDTSRNSFRIQHFVGH